MDTCKYCFCLSVYGLLVANICSPNEGRIMNRFIMYYWNILCGIDNAES
jgi:hypothetical protein